MTKTKITDEQEKLLFIGNTNFIKNPETRKVEKWMFLPYYFKTDDNGETYETVHLEHLPEYVKNFLEELRNKTY